MVLSIRPMQWTNLPELHQTPTLDDSDLDCLEEIRDVLSRHGKLARFAMHLAHRHFELAPGEILIERPDPDARTQHVTVGRLDDEPEARPTTWLFEEGPEMRLSDAVYCVCVSDPNKTEACIRHGKSRSPTEKHQRDEAVKERRISEEKARYEQGPDCRPQRTQPGKVTFLQARVVFCIRPHGRFQANEGGAFQSASF